MLGWWLYDIYCILSFLRRIWSTASPSGVSLASICKLRHFSQGLRAVWYTIQGNDSSHTFVYKYHSAIVYASFICSHMHRIWEHINEFQAWNVWNNRSPRNSERSIEIRLIVLIRTYRYEKMRTKNTVGSLFGKWPGYQGLALNTLSPT